MISKNPFDRPSFRRWFTATSLLALSTSTTLAVTLAAVDATGSVATAGIITGCVTALALVLGLLGGVLSDFHSRRYLLKVAVLVSALSDLCLVVLLCILVFTPHQAAPWLGALVVAALLVSSAGTGLADPVLDSSVKMIISPPEFPRAMSAAHARSSTLSIMGSPLTGGLYGALPPLPFVLRLLCNLGFIAALRNIHDDLGPKPSGQTPGGDSSEGPETSAKRRSGAAWALRGYREAWAFLNRDQALQRILLSAPLVNIMVFSGTTWVVLYLTSRGTSALVTGVVVAGFAVGGIIGSALTPALTDRVASGWLAICGLGAMTLTFAALFLVPRDPWFLFAIAVVCMIPSPALNGGLFGYVFAKTPSDMQGRVMAVFGVVGGSASVLAPMAAGLAVGNGLTLLLASAACLVGVIGVVLLWSSKAVRNMPRT